MLRARRSHMEVYATPRDSVTAVRRRVLGSVGFSLRRKLPGAVRCVTRKCWQRWVDVGARKNVSRWVPRIFERDVMLRRRRLKPTLLKASVVRKAASRATCLAAAVVPALAAHRAAAAHRATLVAAIAALAAALCLCRAWRLRLLCAACRVGLEGWNFRRRSWLCSGACCRRSSSR